MRDHAAKSRNAWDRTPAVPLRSFRLPVPIPRYSEQAMLSSRGADWIHALVHIIKWSLVIDIALI
jgi:hypothetical protein